MLGVKQPTAEVAAVLLKYGVAAQHFCYARFLKLSRCGQGSHLFLILLVEHTACEDEFRGNYLSSRCFVFNSLKFNLFFRMYHLSRR